MGANLLVSLWLLPYVLKYLSKSEYAVFAIAADIVAWLALTSLGVGPSLNVRAGQFIGQKDYTGLNTVTNAAFWGQIFLSILIVGFGVYALNNPSQIISESINDPNLGWVLFLLILGGAIGFISQPLNGLLTANKQIHIDNYLKFGTLGLRTLLTIIFLNLDFKLMSIALSNIIALGFAMIITYWRVKSSIPGIRIHPLEFKSVEFKKLLKTGVWITVGGVAGILIFKADNFIISKYFTLETVTGYFITYKLYSIVDMLHQQLFNQTRPYFVQLYSKNEHIKFATLYKILYNSSFLTASIGGFLIYLINEWFITHWLGTNYFLGNSLNFWMCLNFIIQSSVLPNRIVLVSSLFKVKENGVSRLIEGVIKVTISLCLLPIIGIEALAISGIIASILLSSLYFNFLVGQLIKQNNISNVISTLLLFLSVIVLFTDNITVKVSVLVITILSILIYSRKSFYDGRVYLQQISEVIVTKYRRIKNV